MRACNLILCWFLWVIGLPQMELFAQEPDSARQLGEVVVRAYAYNRAVDDVPATVNKVGTVDLQRFAAGTFVQALNTVPGTRLEERSPGSYRISIRGSTLRSPFGVRNVKVYWNELPLTDPGGNTYFNQLDPAMTGSMEIIKGPGSSLYGAGTGGVLLLESIKPKKGNALHAGFQLGSFGSELASFSFETGKEKFSQHTQVLHQQADGYRNQTRMSRDVINHVLHADISNDQSVTVYIFYSDLFYETPGGLTLNEFNANPRQARPATAILPGAVQQNARVHLQSFYTGVNHEYRFSKKLQNKTGVYGNFVRFNNAAIRNFDHRNEQSVGARSVTLFNHQVNDVQFTVLGGGEFQWGLLPTKSYENINGKEGLLLADDEASVLQYSVFGQGEMRWRKLNATIGLSYNAQTLTFHRLSDVGSAPEQLVYDPVLMPRVALLAKASKNFTAFGSISSGFSPPTLAEINASNGVFNRALEAERGINYEAGLRMKFFEQRLRADVTAYSFGLRETIVIRREEDGAEYFINAGKTDQKGIELMLQYSIKLSETNFINGVNFWSNYSLNRYCFKDYNKGEDNFSGNALTGTPDFVWSAGVDVTLRPGVYVRLTNLYTDALPLNDANTMYADSYYLVGVRAGYRHKRFEVYAGGENLLDERYSPGHDLNAAGGRYYNTAAGRSFYGGVRVNLSF
ncbi:MAG: TonB-dependent receptor plug domain-containing protein [Cyclobacteriaceae bacterium]|nr:TonB-dependent receptor plug domain-containing protein [Cyclobacteriaceae bacterium]